MFLSVLFYSIYLLVYWVDALAVDFGFIHKRHVVGEVSCCGSTIIGIVGDDAVIFDVVFDDLNDLLYDVAFGSIDVICID